MKLNAIGITSTNFKKTVEFYSLLGFKFSDFKRDEEHLEAITTEGSARLMIDSRKLIKSLIGEEPRPSNCSAFALEFESPKEIDQVCKKVANAGFTIFKEPWDAFWGQRYAVVEDPDGTRVDLYAAL